MSLCSQREVFRSAIRRLTACEASPICTMANADDPLFEFVKCASKDNWNVKGKTGGGCKSWAITDACDNKGFCHTGSVDGGEGACMASVRKYMTAAKIVKYQQRITRHIDLARDAFNAGDEGEFERHRDNARKERLSFVGDQVTERDAAWEAEKMRAMVVMTQHEMDWYLNLYHTSTMGTFRPKRYIIPEGDLPTDLEGFRSIADPRSAERLLQLHKNVEEAIEEAVDEANMEFDLEREDIGGEVDKMHEKNMQLEEENEALQLSLQHATEQFDQFNKTNKKLQQENSGLKEMIRELQQENDGLNEKIRRLQQQPEQDADKTALNTEMGKMSMADSTD